MRILALLTFLFLAFAGPGAYLALQQQDEVLRLSAQAPATIIEKQIETSRDHRSTGSSFSYTASYNPVVKFRYRVDEQEFVSNTVFPETLFSGLLYGGNLGRRWAEGVVAKFEANQKVKAYYDPANPRDACLIRRPSMLPYLCILLPFATLSGFLAYFWRSPTTARGSFRRNKAGTITAAWSLVGLASAAHYFYVAGQHFGLSGVLLLGSFATLGLIPLAFWRHYNNQIAKAPSPPSRSESSA